MIANNVLAQAKLVAMENFDAGSDCELTVPLPTLARKGWLTDLLCQYYMQSYALLTFMCITSYSICDIIRISPTY